VLVLATAAGLLRVRRDGRVRATSTPTGTGGPVAVALAALGVRPGTTTLVQFSTVVCAPCVAARRVCAEVAGATAGVAHLEVDAEAELAAVRALDVWRAPTVLVVDRHGTVRHRVAGVPRAGELRAALASLTGLDPAVPAVCE